VQRVQLITDSGCDVLGGGFGGIDVRVIPFPYSLDGSERVDDPQYTPALDTFYEAIRRGARVTTSQVRVADCAQVFRNCANLNTPAVYITLSSGLSGTFEAALRARELVLAERPGAEIYVVDSLSAATGQALLVSEVRPTPHRWVLSTASGRMGRGEQAPGTASAHRRLPRTSCPRRKDPADGRRGRFHTRCETDYHAIRRRKTHPHQEDPRSHARAPGHNGTGWRRAGWTA